MTGRNDPCPCKSGLKFKYCCEKKPPVIRMIGGVKYVDLRAANAAIVKVYAQGWDDALTAGLDAYQRRENKNWRIK